MPKHVAQDGFLFVTREMHLSFENLVITNTFIIVRERGQGYGWLLSYLSIRFVLRILLSPQHYVFILV